VAEEDWPRARSGLGDEPRGHGRVSEGGEVVAVRGRMQDGKGIEVSQLVWPIWLKVA
jgi:hypothetical protein